ncbi:uncharacterized protein LOC130728155 [Lotus japonicus]|uniref:uncharacterized protein LOC130728155 n=1 Tax=Lotus japonicus TaxID=34305 RepID=UPI002589ED0A|nr:uncharacterized protein LOC130728155 [Lotus japonicus]
MRCSSFAMLVLLASVILAIGNFPSFSSATFLCKGNLLAIMNECQYFVKFDGPIIPPSKSCCDVLNNADITCWCKYIPPFQHFYSVERFIGAVETCGGKVAAGTKCGSYIVPGISPSPSP